MKINPYAALKSTTIDKRTGEPFNPYNFGKSARSGKMKFSASEHVFNGDNELNASNKVEALSKIKAILDGTQDGTFNVRTASSDIYTDSVSPEESESILREAFASGPMSEGFHQVGQALLNPIKEVIDYEGVFRKLLAPRTVKAGEVVRYDKDIFVTGYVIAEDGQTPQSTVGGKYIYPSEFEVSAYPSIELKDIYRAQYDVLQRMQDKARQSIEYQEDKAGATMMLAGGTVSNTISYYATLNLGAFESMRYQIERHRLACHAFVIHRQEISDIVNTVSTQVDPVTRRELIMAGYIGSILNAAILTTAGVNTYEILQPGEAFAVTSPEYLGGMPIRVELISEPTNEYYEGRPRRGWYWWELISQVLVNTDGVSIGQKT